MPCSAESGTRQSLVVDVMFRAEGILTLQFFGQRPAFFGQPFLDLCFGIEIRASRGAIVRENDADRNSRTCLAARSARRDDSRRDLGRDRAKEAAKMNVERAHVQILKAVKTRQVGLGLLGAPARRSALHAGCCDGRAKPAPPPIVSCICQRSHTHADAYADGLETACRRARLSVQSACGNSSVRSARRARRQTHAALGSCSRCGRRNVFTRASQRAESDFRLRRLLRYFFARGQSPL